MQPLGHFNLGGAYFDGTPFKSLLWRLIGVRVGKRLYDDGVFISEPTLTVIGDERPGNFGNLSEATSAANLLDWQAQGTADGPFEKIAAYDFWSANLTGGDQPERIQACRVSPGFFAMMGNPITDGREFAPGAGPATDASSADAR